MGRCAVHSIRILSGTITAPVLQALLDGERSYDREDGWPVVLCPGPESREEAMGLLRAVE